MQKAVQRESSAWVGLVFRGRESYSPVEYAGEYRTAAPQRLFLSFPVSGISRNYPNNTKLFISISLRSLIIVMSLTRTDLERELRGRRGALWNLSNRHRNEMTPVSLVL
ncbi:hypothetical protein J6590_011505 [Homalodisca vitripennis]|nr:hypothetical protein J6590_011505 [Homalodisca vitripennis]